MTPTVRAHTMVRFGKREYWVEHRREGVPYGATLTALLDADVGAYQESLARLREALDSGNGYSGRLRTVKARLRELPFSIIFCGRRAGFMKSRSWIIIFRLDAVSR